MYTRTSSANFFSSDNDDSCNYCPIVLQIGNGWGVWVRTQHLSEHNISEKWRFLEPFLQISSHLMTVVIIFLQIGNGWVQTRHKSPISDTYNQRLSESLFCRYFGQKTTELSPYNLLRIDTRKTNTYSAYRDVYYAYKKLLKKLLKLTRARSAIMYIFYWMK